MDGVMQGMEGWSWGGVELGGADRRYRATELCWVGEELGDGILGSVD